MTIINIKNKLFKKINNLSLIKKFMFIISLPLFTIALISIILYSRYETNVIINEIKKNHQSQIEQLNYNISMKIVDIENISELLVSNNTIIEMMEEDNYGSELIFNYDDAFSYINNISLTQQADRIRLFCLSEELPEKWDYIYNINKLSQSEIDLLYSTADSSNKWIGPNQETWLSLSESITALQLNSESMVFSLVNKITDIKGLLGFSVIDISVDTLFDSIIDNDTQDSIIYVISDSGDIVYSNDKEETYEFHSFIKQYDNDEEVIFDNKLHVYSYISSISCYIVEIFDLQDTYSQIRKMEFMFICSLVLLFSVLIFITHMMIKLLLSRMSNMVEQLKHIDDKLPKDFIIDEHEDEIGILSKRFAQLIEKVRLLIENIKVEEELKRKAEFTSMQYQINPHFLYNILDLFQMRAELKEDYISADGITQLAAMLRYNTFYSPTTSINEEINHLKKYIYLQNVRYNKKINLNIECADGLLQQTCLKFILQPIVENSISHGWKNREQEFTLNIIITKIDDTLNLEIKDSGIGMRKDELNILIENLESENYEEHTNFINQINQVGLRNVHNRLQLYYGERSYMHIESEYNSYFLVAIGLPAQVVSINDNTIFKG